MEKDSTYLSIFNKGVFNKHTMLSHNFDNFIINSIILNKIEAKPSFCIPCFVSFSVDNFNIELCQTEDFDQFFEIRISHYLSKENNDNERFFDDIIINRKLKHIFTKTFPSWRYFVIEDNFSNREVESFLSETDEVVSSFSNIKYSYNLKIELSLKRIICMLSFIHEKSRTIKNDVSMYNIFNYLFDNYEHVFNISHENLKIYSIDIDDDILNRITFSNNELTTESKDLLELNFCH